VNRISQFFAFNREGAAVDHLLFHFLTARFVSEVFTVKFESCPKLHLILIDFCPPKF